MIAIRQVREAGQAGQATATSAHKWVWTARWLAILVLMLAGNGAIVWAQRPLPASAVVSTAAEPADTETVRLMVGRSAVLNVGAAITRVSLTSAEIADALVTSPSQLLINGKMPGTISMFVWDRGGALKRYEVVVQRDLARLTEQINELFPGQQIEVKSNGKNVVLSGYVSSKDVIEKVVNVAAGYVDKKEEVTTLLQLQPNAASNQVLLRVRFAEVSRTAMTELGASFAANGYKDGRWFGRSTTQQYAAPQWDEEGKFVFSDFLNLFLFDSQEQLAALVKALQNRGLFQSLAEPNLVSESGKEASFLAGGEFPIPIAQGSGANIGVSVQFKEFGVRLNFTPTVNGDRVHLKVKPEVSTLDFNNAVFLQGFRIPALTTRRTETELELQNGQTFAIAGLMNNTILSSLQKIPGIGDIPIIGLLFRSKAAQKSQTELVVMITPEILPNNSRGVTPNLPRLQEPYLPPVPERRTLPPPPPPFGASQVGPVPQTAQSTGQPGAATSQPATSPASAAASVSALTPSGPQIAQPGQPASQPGATPTVAGRPMTEQERRVLLEEQKKAEERARVEAQAYARAQAVEGRRIAEERARAEKAAREQGKRDAEAARKAQEAAKKQAERDREQQRAIAEAAARLKAAEAAYNAEVARKNNQ